MQEDHTEFMDISENEPWTLEESMAYLEYYLNKEWPGHNLQELMKNKDTRSDIVLHIREKTNISIKMSLSY
jgi:hypothetical protein